MLKTIRCTKQINDADVSVQDQPDTHLFYQSYPVSD